MSALPKRYFAPEEYITLEVKAEYKSQYVAGEISEMRVRVKAGELWTYPDVAALCGEPKFDKSHRPYNLLNPQVVFEVISPTTEQFDRGDKFVRYQKLESLTDYVLVSAERMQIEHYTRQADGNWTFRHYDRPVEVLSRASVNVEMPLAEIYERVQFPEKDSNG